MFLSGMSVALLGVVVFYYLLPDMDKMDSLLRLLNQSPPLPDKANVLEQFKKIIGGNNVFLVARSFGILFFIESIAWYMIKQYRSLIEDFKAYNRLYLKRSNMLMAYHVLNSENITEGKLIFANALLHEDWSRIMKKDETTESLELQKLQGESPVLALIKSSLGFFKFQK